MIPVQRRKIIIDKISSGTPLSVTDLSRELGVSPMTIRRDLSNLEKDGLLARTHGGAVPVGGGSEEEPSFTDKINQYPAEKLAIARKAAELVKDGDTILLNAGTTIMALVQLLKERQNLTVVTNTVNVAMELAQSEGVNLILTGGSMRTKSYAMVGALTERVLREIHVQKAFLGVNGISIEHGLTTPNMTEAHTNSLMVQAADEVIVLADHSKIGRVTLSRFAPITAVTILVTDKDTPRDFIKELAKLGIETIVV
ncbi:DeoR/GlpR family DNA-binding transcription regulator [Moorella sp. Hama-1]|uniref:DeoR/GlpR family DNA-binding transcription regulator n=1 Tax=Moorella sp. Hama-1 TaxID=2138101 RepID=UPI000D65E3B5|nr:DeoR/GlpR family DNA-binding transcription regulator [Moorella sp. Hama-1]MDN5361981.1 DeoR family transcriptional regulator, fructose operon transcriptional repressor [Moorella sp. (in: firmicutes)]BCV20587.1 GntR family transcriptional regulator [Moorella sp. Hama-1]